MKILKYMLFLGLTVGLGSCDKILEIDDPNSALSGEQAYSTAESIRAMETGLYTGNYHNNQIYYQALDLYFPMFSDEMIYRTNAWATYYGNTYSPATTLMWNFWYYCYFGVYLSNDFLAHLENTTLLDEKTLKVYQGEALYFRAYAYMLLVNMYGDVPLILTPEYVQNSTAPKAPASEVWAQVVNDLQTAEQYLEGSQNPKTRITQSAATALLARAYLYMEDWQKAADKATQLIPTADGGQGQGGFQLETVDRVFKFDSKEAINQFNNEGFAGSGTYVGYTRIGSLWVPYTYRVNYMLTDNLVNDVMEEEGDLRQSWIGSVSSGATTYYYPYKYKNNDTPEVATDNEYYVFQRLAEMYLIRAEANAHLNNLSAAVQDLNCIRSRAGLDSLDASYSVDEVLMAVEKERRKELFCEQGHRWFDLKRTGRSDAVYSACDWKEWASYKNLFPIYENELINNPNLTQTPGWE